MKPKSPPIKPALKEYIISIDKSPDGKAGLLVEKAEDGTMTVLAEKYTPAPSSTGEKKQQHMCPFYKCECILAISGDYPYCASKAIHKCNHPTPTTSATDNSSEDWELKKTEEYANEIVATMIAKISVHTNMTPTEVASEIGEIGVIECAGEVDKLITSLLSNNRKQILKEVISLLDSMADIKNERKVTDIISRIQSLEDGGKGV